MNKAIIQFQDGGRVVLEYSGEIIENDRKLIFNDVSFLNKPAAIHTNIKYYIVFWDKILDIVVAEEADAAQGK